MVTAPDLALVTIATQSAPAYPDPCNASHQIDELQQRLSVCFALPPRIDWARLRSCHFANDVQIPTSQALCNRCQ